MHTHLLGIISQVFFSRQFLSYQSPVVHAVCFCLSLACNRTTSAHPHGMSVTYMRVLNAGCPGRGELLESLVMTVSFLFET